MPAHPEPDKANAARAAAIERGTTTAPSRLACDSDGAAPLLRATLSQRNQASDPLAFSFVNFTGGTETSGSFDLDDTTLNTATGVVTNTGSATKFTSEIYVTTGGATTYPNNGAGETIGTTALYGY